MRQRPRLGCGKKRPARPALSSPAKFKSPRGQLRRILASFCSVLTRLSRSSPCARPGQGRTMPSPVGAVVQPPSSGCSPASRSPSLLRLSAGPDTPRTPRRLESSFSVEAILAKPEPRALVTPRLAVSASASAASGLWTAPSGSPAPVLPWECPATWLPSYPSVGLYQRCPQPPALGLRVAHLCGLQGLGVTGTRCPGARVQGSEVGGVAEEWRQRQRAQDGGEVPEFENHTGWEWEGTNTYDP